MTQPTRHSLTKSPWTRRDWLTHNAAAVLAVSAPVSAANAAAGRRGPAAAFDPRATAVRAAPLDAGPVEALAQRAVDAARSSGATYADVRLTRDLIHYYRFDDPRSPLWDVQTLGVGVRALVNGYWGFAGSTSWDADEVTRLAREAVSVAKTNAQGPRRDVELGRYPAATGRWAHPVRIDPFLVPIEEKIDAMAYWSACARRVGYNISPIGSHLQFARQERVVATSDGSLFTQMLYETGGLINVTDSMQQLLIPVQEIGPAAAGWELLMEAKIADQLQAMPEVFRSRLALENAARPLPVGAYTLVCDGATMAAMVERTLGLATQLDRALGYEANAGGTSYLDDPLGMAGQAQIAAANVTLTADRSMPRGLATVRWDDEGVEPDTCTLVKDGVLTDFQTTRESASWLKDYYAKADKPVRSHGHAATSTGQRVPLQHMPNLTLMPGAEAVPIDQLVGSVKDGLFVENGAVLNADFQGRSGLLVGGMRLIRNGRLGAKASGGAVLFSSADFWKKVAAVGGPATLASVGASQYLALGIVDPVFLGQGWRQKGQPPQMTGHTVRAPAAVIGTQAIIDPTRRA